MKEGQDGMKAALYQGQGKIELTTLPDPECTPEGAVLENVYASICGAGRHSIISGE